MFGHLKPEEFISFIDGEVLNEKRLAHLNSCPVCTAQARLIRSVRTDLVVENDISEPDWGNFRDSVRLELLSRSVQRQATVRRWTGWPIRPAMAWGMSFAILIVVSIGGFLWHVNQDQNQPAVVIQQTSGETPDVEEMAGWTETGVFQELSTLEDSQLERLKELVKSSQSGVFKRQ